VLFARNALSLWLGADFAAQSTPVLQWLAIGVFLNSLATIPFALVQGAGRADITGKFHLLELPFYLASVWLLTRHFGIRGTAIAWTLRVMADGVLLFWVADRLLDRRLRLKAVLGGATLLVAVLALGMTEANWAARFVLYTLTLISFFTMTWLVLLVDERELWARSRKRLVPDARDASAHT
jgi:O-antigen/teichoic acid export membrane protein